VELDRELVVGTDLKEQRGLFFLGVLEGLDRLALMGVKQDVLVVSQNHDFGGVGRKSLDLGD